MKIRKTKKVQKKKNRKLILVLSLILIFIVALVFIYFSFSFRLVGSKHFIVGYNQEFKDPGIDVRLFFKDISDKVKTTGKVDTTKLGKYEIKYSYSLGFIPLEKIREVEVVDEIKPVIELTGERKQKLCPKQKYEEEGYIATDDYDGDITDKLEVIETEDSFKYKVTDSSGNTTVIEREFIREDKDVPSLSLKNGSTIYVKKGSSYKERGYTASDTCDGDITDKVVVTGSVDTNKIGTYELVYSVIDESGNETKVTRKVVVNESKSSSSSYVGKPGVIYLTFDDGPSGAGSSAKILNVLKEEGVKATFFVIGTGNDSLMKRAHDEGHAIALHTYTHDYKNIYSSVDAYFNDLTKIQNKVKNITGETSIITRFPGGSNNTISNKYSSGIMSVLRQEVEARGFIYFDWNVDGNDAGTCAKTSVKDKKTCVYNNVTRNLSKSRANVVLLHDIKSYTADAIKDIIHYGKNNGYSFEVLTSSVAPVHFK